MIEYNVFEKFPKETKIKVIEMIFGANTPKEFKRIKNDILTKNIKSNFMNILLSYITCVNNGKITGFDFEVKALIHISPKCFGVNIEEDND